MLFLRVFWTFLENHPYDLAKNAYLDSTNHYLQLFYWSSVPKNYGFRAKVRQSPFLGPKCAQACLGPRRIFSDFLDIWHGVSSDQYEQRLLDHFWPEKKLKYLKKNLKAIFGHF